MIFLGIPFIFGPLRSVSMGLRMMTGIAAGFCFYFSNQLFGPFSIVYQLPAFLAAAIPLIIVACLSYYLIHRVR